MVRTPQETTLYHAYIEGLVIAQKSADWHDKAAVNREIRKTEERIKRCMGKTGRLESVFDIAYDKEIRQSSDGECFFHTGRAGSHIGYYSCSVMADDFHGIRFASYFIEHVLWIAETEKIWSGNDGSSCWFNGKHYYQIEDIPSSMTEGLESCFERKVLDKYGFTQLRPIEE
jgi:hypothetical protein